MRVRILQFKDEDGQWYDEAYAYEDSTGQVTLYYNLTWERVGSVYNGKLKERAVALDQIETVIPPNDDRRWLPVQVLQEEAAASLLAALDETCAIPKARSIAQSLAA